MSSLSNASPSVNTSPYIKDVTMQNFMQEVVQASLQTPVLVYFTSARSAPCKQYYLTLEKLVNEAKGRIRLAALDVDKNPQLAQQFRIQSVPMVYIFLQGEPVDGFAGVMQESQLKPLLSQFLGAAPEEEQVKATLEMAAGFFTAGEYVQALQCYQAVLEHDKENIDAVAGLVNTHLVLGEIDKAKALLLAVPEDKAKHEGIVSAKAALSLVESAPKRANIDALRAKLASAPDDHVVRYDLAVALFVAGKQEEAIAELLTIIAKNKDWNDNAARLKLLTFFEALGHTHPLTMQGRRKLSSLLF